MSARWPRWPHLLWMLACGLPAAACARPLAEMASSGEFIICAAPDELPFSAQGASPAGLFIDLGRMVAGDLGLSLTVRWVAQRSHLRKVSCDALMGAAVLKQESAGERSSWGSALTLPYMRAATVLVTGAGMTAVSWLEQLRNVRVAVPSGSWAHKYMNEHGIPVWVRFRDDRAILGAVARGEAEAGVVSNLAAAWYGQRHGAAAIKVLDSLLDQEEFGFDVAVKLIDSDQAALDKVNAILRQRLDDGSIAAMAAGYGAWLPASVRGARSR